MKALWRPTLVKRVVFVVLAAFVLVLMAIQATMYLQFRQSLEVDQRLSRLGRSLAGSLTAIDDEQQALAVVRAIQSIYANLRLSGNPSGTLLLQLSDSTGRTVYASPALGKELLNGPEGRVGTQMLGDAPYWVYRSDSARWSLRLAEPERTIGRVLQNNTRVVLPYLLLAVPIVVLPVWLAVAFGLRPLRRVADVITRRSGNDLSPLHLDVRHAELKPLVVALERLLAQLRDKLARERAFVHDAAHEMRTPMAVIAAQAHALSGAGNPQDRQRAKADLEQAIERASHLTQQLLALASLDTAQRPAPQPVDIAQLTRQALAQAAPSAMARGIELSLDAPDDLPAWLDRAAFRSVLENLLHNAIRYGREDGHVAVALERIGGAFELRVDDDGPGIPPPERDKVFERFYRGIGMDATGSGLGLAIVRQAVQGMGGEVMLGAGLPPHGAGFRVSLPLAATTLDAVDRGMQETKTT